MRFGWIPGFLLWPLAAWGGPAGEAPLELVRTIALPGIEGRIDHLAGDGGKRLFVAALASNSVLVIDLEAGVVAGRIPGVSEPQGIAYLPNRNRLAVASAGDGMLHLYDALTARWAGAVQSSRLCRR